jgi:putative NADH-flavin reductase
MLRIALVGSTGRIGSRIAQEARARGHEVVEMLRAAVDLFDPRALAVALRGSEVLVSAYGAPADEPHKLPQATSSMLQAAQSAGLSRVLAVGGCGALAVPEGGRLADTEGFPAALQPKVRAHEDAVAILASSSVAWTCMSPPEQIGPGERTARYRLAPGALVRDAGGRSAISYDDFACAAIDELEAPRYPRQLVGAGY